MEKKLEEEKFVGGAYFKEFLQLLWRVDRGVRFGIRWPVSFIEQATNSKHLEELGHDDCLVLDCSSRQSQFV